MSSRPPPASPASAEPPRALYWAVLIVLLALGLRAAHALSRDAIHRDEGQQIAIVDGAEGVGDLWRALAAEGAPPLHYLAEYAAVRAFGDGLGPRRALSVAFGTAAAALVLVLGWRAFGARCGLFAGVLAATSPFLIHYSGTTRSYALFSALAGVHALAYLAFLARPGYARALLWGATAALMAYTHYFAFHIVLAGGLYALWRFRSWRGVRLCAAAGAACIVLYAPWLSTLTGQLGHELQPWAPGEREARYAAAVLKPTFGDVGRYLGAYALIGAWWRLPRREYASLVTIGLGACVIAWLVQIYRGPFQARYLIGMSVALVPPVCAYLLGVKSAWLRRTLIVVLLLSPWADGSWLRPVSPIPDVIETIERESRPDDLLWVYPPPFGSSFFWHYEGDLRAFTGPFPGRKTLIDWPRYVERLTDLEQANRALAELEDQLARGGRVWLVSLDFHPFGTRWAFGDDDTPELFGRARMLHAEHEFHRRAMRILHAKGVYELWRTWPDRAYHEPVTLILFRPRRPDEPLVIAPEEER